MAKVDFNVSNYAKLFGNTSYDRRVLASIVNNEKLMGIEVDIIAEAPSGDVCFVEVKSRSSYSYGYAVEAVTPAKINRYKRFINLYSQIHGLYDKTLRIDVIAICGDDVEHIENVAG